MTVTLVDCDLKNLQFILGTRHLIPIQGNQAYFQAHVVYAHICLCMLMCIYM